MNKRAQASKTLSSPLGHFGFVLLMLAFGASVPGTAVAGGAPALAIAVALPSAATAGIAPAGAQASTVEGTWSTRISDRNGDDRIQIRLERDRDRGHSSQGFSVDAGELDGLTMGQASGTASNVRFALVRDAGTITFEGNIRDGRGTGTFGFTPNSQWVGQMDGLGYDWDDDEVFFLAIQDVTTAWVEALQDLGYTNLPGDDLFAFAIHGVGPEFIRALNDLGYRSIDADDLVAMRIHGVSPEFVRDIRGALGG